MKKFRNLSLVLAGFALGVTVAYSPQIHATATSLLGSKVGKVLNVKIDNKSIGSGAVINGTTYVPLRVTANEMGLEVTKVDSKEVTLSSGSTSTIQDNSDQIRLKISDVESQISQVNTKIKYAQDILNGKDNIEKQIKSDEEYAKTLELMKANGSSLYNEGNYNAVLERIENSKSTLAKAESDLPELQKQLADLEKQKADLQAQL